MSQQEFPCAQCGAALLFEPGTASLSCPYCDHENPIDIDTEPVAESDYLTALDALEAHAVTVDSITVKCTTCGAATSLESNVTSTDCPFCGSPIVATDASRKLIKPQYLLPFHIKRKEAGDAFNRWLHKLWFAPGSLKRKQRHQQNIQGIYVPYWTYDSRVNTAYTGERGTHYYVTQTYTTRVNGKMQTRTRQVRKTRWRSASGTVRNTFDDVLVRAGASLPHSMAEKLEPWDLKNLVSYEDDFLSGFRAETYSVNLREGFTFAKGKMEPAIRETVRRDIGGDEQRIHRINCDYRNIAFKHILLPIWISAYAFKGKTYRFLVNGRTGEVQGNRPYSWPKIALAVLAVSSLLAGLIYFLERSGVFDS